MILNILLIGTVVLIGYILYDFMKQKRNNLISRLVWYSFLFYAIVLLHFTSGYIFIPPQKELVTIQYQIIPFQFLFELFDMYRSMGAEWLFWETLSERIFSFLMLLPLGIFFPLLFRVDQVRSLIWNAFLVSFFIEFYQVVLSYFGIITYRIFNIDSLLLNIAGALIGFYLYKLILLKWIKLG